VCFELLLYQYVYLHVISFKEESFDKNDFLKGYRYSYACTFAYPYFFTELTSKCSETIVLLAFGTHFFKDIGVSSNIQENLKNPEKNEFIFLLAKALLTKGNIKIKNVVMTLKKLCPFDN